MFFKKKDPIYRFEDYYVFHLGEFYFFTNYESDVVKLKSGHIYKGDKMRNETLDIEESYRLAKFIFEKREYIKEKYGCDVIVDGAYRDVLKYNYENFRNEYMSPKYGYDCKLYISVTVCKYEDEYRKDWEEKKKEEEMLRVEELLKKQERKRVFNKMLISI